MSLTPAIHSPCVSQIGSATLNNINSLAFYNAAADKQVIMTEKTRGGKKK
jgi:hypothetical protein